jgi:small-conductance mechanosensitive channel
MTVLDTTLYHNTVREWLIAAGIGLGAFIALRIVLRVVRGRLRRLADRTRTEWDDLVVSALSRTKQPLLLVFAVSAGARWLDLPANAAQAVHAVTVLTLVLQVGAWLSAALGAWLDRYTARQLETDRGAATTVKALGFLGNLVIWAVVVLVALDNLGIEITTLVAGLGVGGIAIALAVQNVLGDLFASLSIVLDKPFVLGDFIIVDDLLGSVEHIGFKTTRVRSLWGEQVIFANSDLLKSRLRNFGRMAERRIVFEIGVTYQTPREKLKAIPAIIRSAIGENERARFDRAHFKSYGDFAIQFEAVYYVLAPDYNVYMDIQQAVNLAIHERFEREGIEFAYPTQTVFVVQQPA